MSNIFSLFFEFFKVGLFTFGGGYGSLPFLYQMVDSYNWFTLDELTQLIAISGITPGPIGLNMATFCGFHSNGIIGSLISSFAIILPMLIVSSLVFKLYKTFYNNKYVKSILYVLKPTSGSLLFSIILKLFDNLVFNHSISNISYKALIVVAILFLATFKNSKNPIFYMSIAGIIGLIFNIL